MQQNDILREIRDRTAPSFMPQLMLRAHKKIAQAFNFKARNQNAFTITGAITSMRDTSYNLIRHNRNNTTQKMQIGVTERFSKPGEVLNEIPLFDSLTGITSTRHYIFLQIEKLKMINIIKVMFLLYILDQASEDY